MNKILPYEKEISLRLNHLSLPDEDLMWQDMKERLDKKDDDGGLLIPFFKGCAGWVLLLGVAVSVALYFFAPSILSDKKSKTKDVPFSERKKDGGINALNNDTARDLPQTIAHTDTVVREKEVADNSNQRKLVLLRDADDSDKDIVAEEITSSKISFATSKSNERAGGTPTRKRVVKRNKVMVKTVSIMPEEETDEDKTGNSKESDYADWVEIKTDSPSDSLISKELKKEDTALKTDGKQISKPDGKTDSVAKIEPAKKKTEKSNKIHFAAGLGIWQNLGSVGRGQSAYSPATTTNGTVSAEKIKKPFNYTPAANIRMYKGEEWFIQAEFRIKAPAKINNLLYNQSLNINASTGVHTTTSFYITRMYYHQLPLTFNYFITKNWTVGGGISWNKLSSVFSTEEAVAYNPSTQVSNIKTKEFLFNQSDSSSRGRISFTDHYFQGAVETQYRWKRFSGGLNFSFGLKPFVNYTLPGNSQQQLKNNMLNLFIRYELWKSKQKN